MRNQYFVGGLLWAILWVVPAFLPGYPGSSAFAANNNADLSLFTASGTILPTIPAFSAAVQSYAGTVDYTTGSITVGGTPADPLATLAMTDNGVAVALTPTGSSTTAAFDSSVNLVAGSNVFVITVTAQDGVTTKSYTMTITRPTGPSQVVNVDATVSGCDGGHCNGSHPQPGTVVSSIFSPVQVTLGPGTYQVLNANGLAAANPNFTAWRYDGVATHWTWSFIILDDATRTVLVGGCCPTVVTPTQAIAAANPFAVDYVSTFSIAATSVVDFVIEDYYLPDNAGGVALSLAPVPPRAPGGTIQFSAAAYSAVDKAGTATLTVVRVDGTKGAVAATFATSDGTGVAGVDYTATTQTVSFADGDSTPKTVTVPVQVNTTVRGNETVNLSLTSPSGGAALGTPATSLLTIIQTPTPGKLQFSAPAYNATDTAGSASITVTRIGGSGGAVSATFATSDGSGKAGVDYTATTQTVSFADGDATPKTVTVPVNVNPAVAGNETVNLSLSKPTGGATLGDLPTATLTIIQTMAPSPGNLVFSSSAYSANDTSGNATVTVSRFGGSLGVVSVTVSTSNGTGVAGVDYTPITQSVTFANGDTSPKNVSIPVFVNKTLTGNETVNLSLSNPTGGAALNDPATAQLTIVQTSPPPPPPPPPQAGSLQFTAGAYAVLDSAGNANLTVTRTGGSAGAVSVTLATANGTGIAGVDYTATTQTVSFADGDTAPKTVVVPVLIDSAHPGNKTVTLTLSNPTGGASLGTPATASLTITQASTPAGTIQFGAPSYTANSTGTVATVTVTRTGGSSGAISTTFVAYDGTGVAGTDYTRTNLTVTFADGDTTAKILSIPLLVHPNPQGSATVNLRIGCPSGGAVLGEQNLVVLTITQPIGPLVVQSGKGGGGAMGAFELLGLGLLVVARRRMRLLLSPVARSVAVI